jgi:hypothetical protein
VSRVKLYTHVEEPADVTVIIPYTKPSHTLQTAIDCLRIQQVQPYLVRVGDGDDYWRLLRQQWAMGGPFFIVEQDVLVWQGAIRAMFECDEKWCTLATMCHGRMITTTFGCVKFGQQVIEQNPGFWDDIPTTWFHLDANFTDKMGWPFIKPHSHWPPATHLNEVQWPDEISMRYSLERKLVWRSMEEGKAVASVRYRVAEDQREHVAHATVDDRKEQGNGISVDQHR